MTNVMFPAATSAVALTRSGGTMIRGSTAASPAGSLTSTCRVPEEIDGDVEELPHAVSATRETTPRANRHTRTGPPASILRRGGRPIASDGYFSVSGDGVLIGLIPQGIDELSRERGRQLRVDAIRSWPAFREIVRPENHVHPGQHRRVVPIPWFA